MTSVKTFTTQHSILYVYKKSDILVTRLSKFPKSFWNTTKSQSQPRNTGVDGATYIGGASFYNIMIFALFCNAPKSAFRKSF